MKILRLSLKNLNSFGRAIELDFASPPLSDTPLLAITGPTGSGKTTLLDAISVSLFNKTPRLAGNEQNNPVNLLRQGEKEGYAEVLFEVRGNRYLARWEVTRDRKGSVKPSVKLMDAASGKLITGRSTAKRGAVELEDRSVEDAVSGIIGLDFAAFNRSVMLAQGEFAAFLKAEPEKKREILQKIAGLDIYESLKKTLTDKVRSLQSECELSEKALSQFTSVTAEQLVEEEKRYIDITDEITGLQSKKNTVSAKKDEEALRSDKYSMLSDRKASHESLIAQQKSIEEIEMMLKAAQRAIRARAESEAHKTEELNKSLAENAVREADGKLRAAAAEVDAQALRRDDAEKKLSLFMEKKESRIAAINAARTDEAMAGEKRKQAEETGGRLGGLMKEMTGKAAELNDLEKEIKEIAEQIEGDERFIRNNEVPADAGMRREEGASILSDLKSTEQSLADSKKQHAKKSNTEKELLKKQRDSEAVLLEKVKASEAAEQTLEERQKARENMLTGGNADIWEKEKAQAASLQATASDWEHIASRAAVLETERIKTEKAIAALNERCASLLLQKDDITALVSAARENAGEREKEMVQALVDGNTAVLRSKHLHDGEPCPVCGSVEHPWKDRGIAGGEEIRRKAEEALIEARNLVEKHQREMSSLELEITRCNAEKAHAEAESLKTDSELQSIKAGMDECADRWRSIYPDSAPSTKYLNEIIESREKKLREYQQAERLEQESKSSVETAQAAVTLGRSGLNGINEQLSIIREEIDELQRTIEQQQARLRTGEADFLRVIPERYHRKEWEQSLRSFAEALDEIGKSRERLSTKRPEQERARTRLENLQDLISGKNNDIAALEKDSAKLQQEEKSLAQSALEKTGGLGSVGAAAKLENEQKALEGARDTAMKAFQRLEEDRIRLQAELEQKNIQYSESCIRSEKAFELYRKALDKEGFESPEEHRLAFRDDEWLEKSSSTINTHRENLRSTENQIRELEEAFAEKAFDAEELGRIRAEEEMLDSALGEKLRGEGELKGRIVRMKDDLQKKKESGDAFENLCRERDRWMRLQSCISGNTLRDFALESVFSHLVYLARQQLLDITRRYELKAGSNFRISVLDRWNGCLERPVETLSGGETFLVSLSLALALSDLSRGHTELDSLFLDEGFGTLDSDTLEVVMATLEKLHLSGKRIALISHIHDLTRRIPVRIAVKREGEGSSTVSIEGE